MAKQVFGKGDNLMELKKDNNIKKIKRSAGSIIFDNFNNIFMLIILICTLYPLYYIFIVSISNGWEVMNKNIFLYPKGINISSYKIVFQDHYILTSMFNSILYTGLGVIINLVMTTLCAYPLSKKSFGGRKFFSSFVIFTMFFTGGMIPTYIVINSLGLMNTIWAIVLPPAINTWYMIIMRTFFEAIPESLFESANLDGASEIKVLFTIVFPLSLPIMATMFMFYAVWHWNSFFPALLYLNEKRLFPLQMIIRNIVVNGDFGMQTMDVSGSDGAVVDTTFKFAAIMVATFPILIIYPFVQRFFVKGVMIGAIKG